MLPLTANTTDPVSSILSISPTSLNSQDAVPLNKETASSNYAQGPPPPPQVPQHFGYGAPQGYAFQYSQCTGRRKALLIGINYFGQRGQLRGCINDVRNMSTYLVENFGYKREDMVILTDDQQNPMSQPSKQNILRAMHWLVKEARPDDSLFFHYSGKPHPLPWPPCPPCPLALLVGRWWALREITTTDKNVQATVVRRKT